MTHIEQKQKEVADSITEATYTVKVQAHSGPYSVTVKADCTVEGEEANESVLEALKTKARRKIFMSLGPQDFREGLFAIDATDHVKAWAVSTLWFALAPIAPHDTGEWKILYNEWKDRYNSIRYRCSLAGRDEVLRQLGADSGWIDSQIVSRPQLTQNIQAKLKMGQQKKD